MSSWCLHRLTWPFQYKGSSGWISTHIQKASLQKRKSSEAPNSFLGVQLAESTWKWPRVPHTLTPLTHFCAIKVARKRPVGASKMRSAHNEPGDYQELTRLPSGSCSNSTLYKFAPSTSVKQKSLARHTRIPRPFSLFLTLWHSPVIELHCVCLRIVWSSPSKWAHCIRAN